MLELLRKYRLRLLAGCLILAALLFYSTNLRHQNNTTLFEKIMLQIASPLLYGFDSTCRTTDTLWSRYLWLIDTEQQNEALRAENRRLRGELIDLQEVRLANERLRELLDFREEGGLSGVAARIIAVDASSLFRTVLIDKGRQHGLREGLPVVVAEGVVGRVIKCTPRQSRVLLVTDASSTAAALVQRSRTRAICRGQGDYLTLEFALRRDDIAVGDLIVTSGTGGIFPKGLVLGRTSNIEREAYGLFQTVTVIPEVDFTRLEEVLVLLGGSAMNIVLGYFLFGLAGILIQTALSPVLLHLQLTPELLLILVIYLGLYRQGISGGLAAYTLGLLQDSFAGSCLGLYGLIFLTLYLILRGLAERLNTDSPALLLFMVLCGTLLQAALLIFLLGFLTDAGAVWRTILRSLPLQTVLNLFCAWLLFNTLQMLRRQRSLRRPPRRL